MPAIQDIVNAISADVVSKLVPAYLPPLQPAGAILLGRQHLEENLDAPYVIFMPSKARFEAPSPGTQSANGPPQPTIIAPGKGVRGYQMTQYGSGYATSDTVTIGPPDVPGGLQAQAQLWLGNNGTVIRIIPTVVGSGYLKPPTITISTSTGSGAAATPVMGPNPVAYAQQSSRALFTDVLQFEVHVWGIAPVPDPNGDFEATRLLYQQVIASAHLTFPGVFKPVGGQWMDSKPGATQIDVRGRYFVLGMEFSTPLTDQPLTFAPAGVRPNINDQMTSPTGIVETGWSGLG